MIERMHEKTNGPVFKVIFALVSLSFVLGGIGGTLIGNDNSAVKVNGQEISQQAFNNAKNRQQNILNTEMGSRFWDLMDTPEYAKQFNQSVLNDLITDELLRQYTKELKLGISVEQIKSQIVNTPAFQQDGKFNNNLYLQALRNNNLSTDAYASIVHEGMLLSQIQEGIVETDFTVPAQQEMLAKLLLQKRQVRLVTYPVNSEVAQQTVTNEELQAFYNEHKAELITPEKLKVEYVMVSPKDIEKNIKVDDEQINTYYQTNKAQYVTPAETQVAHIQVATLEEANQIEQALQKGENFATLAKEKSQDTLSAKNDGNLGWAKAGTFPKAFEEAINGLQVGQISQPVQVDNAYHIIKLLDRKAETALPLEAVKAQIVQTIRNELALTDYSNLAREMANKAFEDAGSLESVAKVAGVPLQTSEEFTRQTLPEVFNNEVVVKALFEGDLRQSGQNSEALSIGDETNPQTIFVRVSEYKPQAEQTFEQAKEIITQAVKHQKAEKALIEKAETQVKALAQGQTSNVVFAPAQELVFAEAQVKNPVLSRTVFAMPKPTDRPSYQVARNLAGDIIIVELDKVTDGTLAEFKPFIAQITQADRLMLRNQMIGDLRERAKIEVNQEMLDQLEQPSQ